MKNGFLKPPGWGIWLLLLAAGALVLGIYFPSLQTPAAVVCGLCVLIALGVVCLWLARCIGYLLGGASYAFMQGYRDGQPAGKQPTDRERP